MNVSTVKYRRVVDTATGAVRAWIATRINYETNNYEYGIAWFNPNKKLAYKTENGTEVLTVLPPTREDLKAIALERLDNIDANLKDDDFGIGMTSGRVAYSGFIAFLFEDLYGLGLRPESLINQNGIGALNHNAFDKFFRVLIEDHADYTPFWTV